MAQSNDKTTIIDKSSEKVSEKEMGKQISKMDLRVQKTYKLLTTALMDMLKTTHFEDITVRKLCEKAMVRPATFYKHFADKYELFTFLVKEVQEQSREIAKNKTIKEQNYYIELINETLTFLEDNKSMVNGIVHSGALSILIDLLSEQIEFEVNQEFKEDKKNGVEMPGDTRIMASIFTGSLIYLCKWWVLSGWAISKEDLIKECVKICKI